MKHLNFMFYVKDVLLEKEVLNIINVLEVIVKDKINYILIFN